ncbi:ATP-binding cassette domain-containing protein, partial [Pseudomonas marginalis]
MNQSAQALAAHPADLAVSRPTAVAASASVKLKVQDLHKSYGEHEVLKGVSLNASKGDVISLIGASGSGKSTLLRCINFLEQPDAGVITLDGISIEMRRGRAGVQAPHQAQLQNLRTRLAMVFQHF